MDIERVNDASSSTRHLSFRRTNSFCHRASSPCRGHSPASAIALSPTPGTRGSWPVRQAPADGYGTGPWRTARIYGWPPNRPEPRAFLGSVGYARRGSLLPGLKLQYPWLSHAPHHALQHTLRDLDGAFAGVFSKSGGYPKFKRRGRPGRRPFPGSAAICGDWVKLPKLGWVLQAVTPCRRQGPQCEPVARGRAWFVSFCVEGDFGLPNAGNAPVGLDLGVAASMHPLRWQS